LFPDGDIWYMPPFSNSTRNVDGGNMMGSPQDGINRQGADTPVPRGTPAGPMALVVGHPGHELRVYGWLEAAHPLVFVLTDGSGVSGLSRIAETARVLDHAGGRHGGLFGRYPDGLIYEALLRHDYAFFLRRVRELAAVFVREKIALVAGDAAEGYNPIHDVCRLVVDAAVRRASRAVGRSIANYDFLVVGPPDACPEAARERALWLQLHDAAFQRKVEAAQSYTAINFDFLSALGNVGVDQFRVECLRPVAPNAWAALPAGETPFYERHGESRVAAGRYRQVIRFHDHVRPLAEALGECEERRAG
jgi:hypothetical protein